MSGWLNLTRVLHVSVNSSSAPKPVRDFYAELLGPPATRPEVPGVEGAWFAAGLIHLVETPGDGPRGLHWCFGVSSLAEARGTLRDRGIPWTEGQQRWADGRVVDQLWFADPTGAVIELQEDPAPQDLAHTPDGGRPQTG